MLNLASKQMKFKTTSKILEIFFSYSDYSNIIAKIIIYPDKEN